jgi:hypothetical protein
VPLNIEMKRESFKTKQDVQKLIDTIADEISKRRIVVVSQSRKLLRWFRASLTECPTGLSAWEAILTFLRGIIPGLPLGNMKNLALESIHLISPVCFVQKVEQFTFL